MRAHELLCPVKDRGGSDRSENKYLKKKPSQPQSLEHRIQLMKGFAYTPKHTHTSNHRLTQNIIRSGEKPPGTQSESSGKQAKGFSGARVRDFFPEQTCRCLFFLYHQPRKHYCGDIGDGHDPPPSPLVQLTTSCRSISSFAVVQVVKWVVKSVPF